MKVDIEFENSFANKLIENVLYRLETEPDLSTIIEDTGGFYKLYFLHKYDEKCPFSFWFSFGNGDKLFFNLGHPGQDATVLHYVDISSEEAINSVQDFIDIFLSGSVEETKVFCKGRLKRIEYFIHANTLKTTYSYLHESSILCLNKTKEIKKYVSWR